MRTRNKSRRLPHDIAIIYEDSDIIVIDKPAGLLTMATDREAAHTAYYILTDYVRKGSAKSGNRIFIVHRLDRETSGILIFARNPHSKSGLQDNWEKTQKKYLAVVHGRPPAAATLSSNLEEVSVHRVRWTNRPGKGKPAKTAYRVLKQTRNMALLEIDLLTGRKHQIRVHLADAGYPVVGDRKYGMDGDTHSRLALYAFSIDFTHPTSGERLTLQGKVPSYFESLVGKQDDKT